MGVGSDKTIDEPEFVGDDAEDGKSDDLKEGVQCGDAEIGRGFGRSVAGTVAAGSGVGGVRGVGSDGDGRIVGSVRGGGVRRFVRIVCRGVADSYLESEGADEIATAGEVAVDGAVANEGASIAE